MSNNIPSDIYEVIEKAIGGDISNYSIVEQDKNKKGDGYLSQICFVSLQEKNSKEEINLVIKQALVNEALKSAAVLKDAFIHEIDFYDAVLPALLKFQKNFPRAKVFDKTPKCFVTVSDDGAEKIVLENLKPRGFVTFDKRTPLDKEHIEVIFKTYGRYHAMSFAYKERRAEEYSQLQKKIKGGVTFKKLAGEDLFLESVKYVHELSLQSLHPGKDQEIIEKYEIYLKDCSGIFLNSFDYEGHHSAILHGDCWSNNMLFKYDENKKIIDMRFIDFQFARIGTPVWDLSYCFYSGGQKEIFDELDYFLKIYYESLSEALREYDCAPEKVYPFHVLKKDWKVYSKFGFGMGLVLWKEKFTLEEDIRDFADVTDEVESEIENMKNSRYDVDAFKKITRDLLVHMYENDFL